MTEKELLLRIRAAVDAGSFGKVKDNIGSLGGAAVTAGKTIAAGFAIGVAAVGVAGAVLLSTIGPAEALADAQARVGAVFKDSAGEVTAAAQAHANALGLTREAYLAQAGALGEYAMNLGLNKTKAAEYATSLTELAPKIAAYTGAEQGAVSDALQKALAGKTKALEAMGYHIEKAPKGLSDAAAAEFYYKQVLEQSANAQKLWNDNAGDTDVSLQRLGASFTDAKATVGTLVAQAVAPWLKTAADYAEALSTAFQTGGIDGLVAKFNELTGIDLSGWVAAVQQKWADVTAAFQDGGIVAALSEIVGFDVQPLLDNLAAAKDAALAFWHDAIEPTAAFILGTVIPAIVSLGGWLAKHKELLVGAAAAYGTLRAAMAVQALFKGVSDAASLGSKAMVVWGNVMKLAGIQTSFFSTALKIAAGPIGWLILAVGLLAAAWAGNWGGIREKTAAVVEWIKTIPAQLAAGWQKLQADLVALVVSWSIKWAEMKQHPVKAFAEILAFLALLPAKMLRLGLDIVMGVWNGLKQGWSNLVSWWKGKQDEIPGAIIKHHDMNSPAKLEYKLGYWITQGLALGIEAGGVLAVEAMRTVLTRLDEVTAKIDPAKAVAASAKAAVDAALAADGVVRGARESAAEAWGKYYDNLKQQEDDRFDREMAHIETLRHEQEDRDAKELTRLSDKIDVEKRHFDWLKSQQEQEAARNGGQVGPKLEDFGIEVRRVDAAFAEIFKVTGDKNLAEFWKRWNDDANANITTTEDLGKAIDAVLSELQKVYDRVVGPGTQKIFDDLASAETTRHNKAIADLLARKKIVDDLIAAQIAAEQDVTDLIELRNQLLRDAETAIRNAQKAAEEGEDRVHKGVMAAIAAERQQRTSAHNYRMVNLGDQQRAEDALNAHNLAGLQAERDALTKGFDERERQIETMRTDLAQLKLDLGVDAAANRLTTLKQQLQDLVAVASSFQVALRGKESNEAVRKAAIERARITTEAQRQALEGALASGSLNEQDRRRVELLLAGRGTQKVTDIKRILTMGQQALESQITAQQAIVDANAAAIAAREHEIELAEQTLKIDRSRAVDALAAIDARVKAEDARHEREATNIKTRITLEQQRFDDEMGWLDRIADAEDRRHEQRMTDIASEYALELARLGMTQAQIDDLVAKAQAEAARIARETEETFKRLRDSAAYGASAGEAGSGLSIGGRNGLDGPGLSAFTGAVLDLSSATAMWSIASNTLSAALTSPAASTLALSNMNLAAAITNPPRRPAPHGADDEEYWSTHGYGDVRHHYADRQKYLNPPKPEWIPPPEWMTHPGNMGTPFDPNAPVTLTGDVTLQNVTSKEATIESVDLGGLMVETSAVLRLPSGRELALETVDALVEDATLLDKLGKKLNERKGSGAQIRGGP